VIVPPYLPDNEQVRRDLALYYDEISRMDQYVGDVVEYLEQKGLDDNTFVLFISDNGRPFPRDKTTLYEGGIKTPWIVKWPEKIEGNVQNHGLVSSIDIAPTFLTLAGIVPEAVFEGKDFSPMLSDVNAAIRDEIYAEDHWHDFEDYTRAIRTREFKYIRNFYTDLPNTPPADAFRSPTYQSMLELKAQGKLATAQMCCLEVPRPVEELYDIINDPYELINLATLPEYESKLNDMRTRLDRIRVATKDFVPERRTPDDFDRTTGLPTEFRIRPRPSKAQMLKKLEE
jgi:arylsulfatase A-like enzyme